MRKPSRICFRGRYTFTRTTFAPGPGGGKVPTDVTWREHVPGTIHEDPAARAPRRPTGRGGETKTLDYTHRLLTPVDVSLVGPQWRVTAEASGEKYTVVEVRDEGGDGSTWTVYLMIE